MVIETEKYISKDAEKIIISTENYQKIISDYKTTEDEKIKLQSEVFYLKHELDKLKRAIFGSKSERFIAEDKSQLSAFELESVKAPEVKTEEITYSRIKQNTSEKKEHLRIEFPSHLLREEVIIEPIENINQAKKIGEAVTEILEYKPGLLFVKKYIRPKYLLTEESRIVIGELPSLPIPRGNAGAGLLAHITVGRYVDHLPFNRQIEQFKRQGIVLPDTTVHGWFSGISKQLEVLYEKHKEIALKSNYVQSDETPIDVLRNEKKGSTHQGYFWGYNFPLERLVLFEYSKGRGRATPVNMLKEFKGALQTDGYNAYDIFENKEQITLLACMAHARRKFDEALNNDKVRASQALSLIQDLYKIEKEAREKELSYEARKQLRIEKSTSTLNDLKLWLDKNLTEVLPKSAIAQAIKYTLGLWNRLIRYIEDGRYEIDNNLIENKIRPIAVGRKNYLFAGSDHAAQRSAMMYSFFGTCKVNNVNPYIWLKDVLERLPECKQSELENLLPQNWAKNQ
jgi:transposase